MLFNGVWRDGSTEKTKENMCNIKTWHVWWSFSKKICHASKSSLRSNIINDLNREKKKKKRWIKITVILIKSIDSYQRITIHERKKKVGIIVEWVNEKFGTSWISWALSLNIQRTSQTYDGKKYVTSISSRNDVSESGWWRLVNSKNCFL